MMNLILVGVLLANDLEFMVYLFHNLKFIIQNY